MLDISIAILTWGFLLVAGLPIVYLFVLTLAAFRPAPKRHITTRRERIAVLIPAHNESLLIADTVGDVLKQSYPRESYTVLVIADNCTDDTATLAKTAGARILERQGNPGKGQALHEALEMLRNEDWTAFLIMDADSHLHPDTLESLNDALQTGARAIQIRYGVLNPNDSIRTQSMELSTASFNALRPRGRDAMGFSAGIYGNGFCLSREVIGKVPYLAHSIVEDIEYHILLLEAGYRVAFRDDVWVKAQMPTGGKGSKVQRIRWERGRIIMIRAHAARLLSKALTGEKAAFDGFLDVIMPPASLIALSLLPPLLLGSPTQRLIVLTLAMMLFLHYFVAAWRYANLANFFHLALYIPWYVLWKSYVIVASLLTQRHLPWVRTDRHKHEP